MTKSRSAPIVAFHGSPNPEIEAFAPLSHFGSRAAALARGGTRAKGGTAVTLYEVALDLAKPARITDLPSGSSRPAVHGFLRLLDQLHYDTHPAILSGLERRRIFAAAAPFGQNQAAGLAALADILEARGIDGFCYLNQFEDPGSRSWIILRSSQARIISKTA